jgi:hypothetical protein
MEGVNRNIKTLSQSGRWNVYPTLAEVDRLILPMEKKLHVTF